MQVVHRSFGRIETVLVTLVVALLSVPALGQVRGGADRRAEGGLAGGAEGAEPFSMEVVSGWGGPVNDVEVVGNIAYVGQGSRFVALDVTDPANITEIGSLDLVVTITDIAIQGHMAYVVTHSESFVACPGPYGFCRVNISNPAQPTLDSYEDMPGLNQLREVALHSTTAFITHPGTGGPVEMVDLVPAQMNHVGTLTFPGFASRCLHVEGDLLFIGSNSLGSALRIYSLQPNPTQPVLLGEAAYPPGEFLPSAISVSNGVAAILARKAGGGPETVMFFDVSNPARPQLESIFDQFGQTIHTIPPVTGITVVGDYAIVAQGAEVGGTAEPDLWQAAMGVVVLNIADLSNPVLATSVKTHGSPRDVRVFGNRAYVMDDGEGLIIYDISNPETPQRVGHHHSPAHIRGMVKNGGVLYVADKWDGFTILEVSDPLNTPVVLGRYQTPFVAVGANENTRIDHLAIDFRADRVYLMTNTFGVHVVDVSNPASPQLIVEVPNPIVFVPTCLPGVFPTNGRTLEVNGDVLHATFVVKQLPPVVECRRWAFSTFDISDPDAAPLISLTQMEAGISDSAPNRLALQSPSVAHGTKLDYVATINTGWPTFSNATVTGTSLPDDGLGVDVSGTTRFVVSDNMETPQDGFYVQNVANPTNPVTLAHVNIDTPGVKLQWAWDVAIQSDRAYVFGIGRPDPICPNFGLSCILAFDVAIPANPVLLGHAFLDSEAASNSVPERGILIADEPFIYAAGGRSTATPFLITSGLTVIRINGLPSDCPADINNSGAVDVDDLITVILSWGCTSPPQSGGCPADINDSGTVDVDDLIAVILNWGTCD